MQQHALNLIEACHPEREGYYRVREGVILSAEDIIVSERVSS
jgi:hypothetical protein